MRYALPVALLLCAAGCKKTAAPDAGAPAPVAAAADAGAPVPAAKPEPAASTARFVSLAEMRQHPLFEPFAGFVETDDDIEESSSSVAAAPPADGGGGGEDEDVPPDDEASPDRPPSDLQVTRLAVDGEVYTLSYEENCGEGLEDRRDLHNVLLERKEGKLLEVQRQPLCGEAQHGFALDIVPLRTTKSRDLVVRAWAVDPEGVSEHRLDVFAPGPTGLKLLGTADETFDNVERFDVTYPRRAGTARIAVGIYTRAEADAPLVRQAREYRLGKDELVPVPVPPPK